MYITNGRVFGGTPNILIFWLFFDNFSISEQTIDRALNNSHRTIKLWFNEAKIISFDFHHIPSSSNYPLTLKASTHYKTRWSYDTASQKQSCKQTIMKIQRVDSQVDSRVGCATERLARMCHNTIRGVELCNRESCRVREGLTRIWTNWPYTHRKSVRLPAIDSSCG